MDSFYHTQEAPGILCSLLLFATHIQMANLLSARSLTDKRKGRKTAHMAAQAHTRFSCKILQRQTPGQQDRHWTAPVVEWRREFFKDRWAGETKEKDEVECLLRCIKAQTWKCILTWKATNTFIPRICFTATSARLQILIIIIGD